MKFSLDFSFQWAKLYSFLTRIEWSSDELNIYVLGQDLIAKIIAEDGSIQNLATYSSAFNLLYELSISETKVLIAG